MVAVTEYSFCNVNGKLEAAIGCKLSSQKFCHSATKHRLCSKLYTRSPVAVDGTLADSGVKACRALLEEPATMGVIARMARHKEAGLSLCKWSCLVIFIIGLV